MYLPEEVSTGSFATLTVCNHKTSLILQSQPVVRPLHCMSEFCKDEKVRFLRNKESQEWELGTIVEVSLAPEFYSIETRPNADGDTEWLTDMPPNQIVRAE